MFSIMIVDLNADVAEGSAADANLMALVTSANIACGFHAGDAPVMLTTLELAAQHGVQVGAHPGFPDRLNFGRQELQRAERDVFADCVYQIGALIGLARSVGVRVRHVKPHGALYNLACRDEHFARPVVAAASQYGLPLVGLPGSALQRLCQAKVDFVPEGFADRRYESDGSLTPRSQPNACIHDAEDAVQQALRLLRSQGIRTLCVHGDNPEAIRLVKALRAAFLEHGVTIAPFA